MQQTVVSQPSSIGAPTSGLGFGQAYQIQLPQFEGPFDLLLFFIQRDELNSHDIPISRITSDFLLYLQQMQDQQIELAGEFMLMAAQLMKIKAAMLLPRPKPVEGEAVDPRTELVDRLLEYKRYKLAADELEKKEQERAALQTRGYATEELNHAHDTHEPEPGDELVGLSVYNLFKVYERLIRKAQTRNQAPRHVIQRYSYTLEQVKEEIVELVGKWEKIEFGAYVALRAELMYIIFSFLGILELVQQRRLKVVAGEGHNQFWLMRMPEAEAA